MAKKGPVNQWHFSHDASPDNGPAEECEISFLVSCRQFIADAARAGELPDITTPPVIYFGKEYRGSTVLTDIRWSDGISNFDLSGSIGDFQLHIYLSYPGRESPVLPENRDKSGFLEINLEPIQKAIDHEMRDGRNIIGQARDLFTKAGEKMLFGVTPYFTSRWIAHPLDNHPDILAEKARRTEKQGDWQTMPAGGIKDRRHELFDTRYYECVEPPALIDPVDPKEQMLFSGRETRYPRGYQGLTETEKELADKNPEQFIHMVRGFQKAGFSEDEACVKAGIHLLVKVRTGGKGD